MPVKTLTDINYDFNHFYTIIFSNRNYIPISTQHVTIRLTFTKNFKKQMN